MANPKGRRSKYESDVVPRFDQIRSLLEIGASEKEVAKSIGIAYSTWNDYKNKHSDFSELITKSRKIPVVEIKAALFRRACGYYTEEVTNVKRSNGSWTKKTVTKHIPPDPASAMILLKHWDKEAGWTNDPQGLEIRKKELELKREIAERDNW